MLGIIGGSGLNQLANLEISHREIVRTPFGEPSAPVHFGDVGKNRVAFIARHGHGHNLAPHRINYRANVWALVRGAGVTQIISVGSVGGIRSDLAPCSLVVPDQIIDYTWGRESSFDGAQNEAGRAVVHIDFTQPFDAGLRATLLAAARQLDEPVIDGGTYAVTQGPRLETAAEIRRLREDGADMVGMTIMPEAALARELAVPYAAICPVVNWAAGCGESAQRIEFTEIEACLEGTLARIRRLLAAL